MLFFYYWMIKFKILAQKRNIVEVSRTIKGWVIAMAKKIIFRNFWKI